MGQNDEAIEAINVGESGKAKDKWTLYLLLCCITASLASFQFGFNIGATNLPTPVNFITFI